jgi:hypothetical protein
VKKTNSVAEWIPNFARRLAQLDHVATLDGGNLNNVEVWLGGLFYPEAYITATRQAVAHRKRWSLETLHLRLDMERVNDPEAFIVDGKTIHSEVQFQSLTMRIVSQGLSLKVQRGRRINLLSTMVNL